MSASQGFYEVLLGVTPMVWSYPECWNGNVMNESIAQYPGLKAEAFAEHEQVQGKSRIVRTAKVLIAVPALICAFGGLIALAVVLSPLIPLIELWRRSLHQSR